MARKHKTVVDEDMDDVDAFHAGREKVLLEQAGEYAAEKDSSESDEEVMHLSDSDEDGESEEVGANDGGSDDGSDDEDAQSDENEEEEAGERWGRKKDYYGGDEAEGDEMAEEALKQQKKHLKELGIDDYYDEDMMEDWTPAEEPKNLAVETDLSKLDSSEKLELLTEKFPEFLPLLKELNKLKPVLETLGSGEVGKLKKVALRGYLGAISTYFSLFMDNEMESLREHPVMEIILAARDVWKRAEALPEAAFEAEKDSAAEEVSEEEEFMDAREELSGEDVSESGSESEESPGSESESESDSSSVDISVKRTIKSAAPTASGDFVEATDDVDAEDKQARKKSLRFYTARIDKSHRNAVDGDLDLPYKERLFERKQRLLEEARKRGQSTEGADLGDSDPEDPENADMDMEDYYNQVKSQKHSKVESRKKAHKNAVKLAKEGKLAQARELVGEDGKRALNFQILKNKGLTAKKRKEVRNARVKKRNKYDQAKKKLSSVRQVYKENQGPYEGEKTGIKKGLSRSVRLN